MAEKATKRRVKDPETFRERAAKATETADKVQKRRVINKVTEPSGKAARGVAGLKILKPFRRPFKLLGRILLPRFVRTSWQELRLVKWPGWRESRRLTFAVIVFAIIFGLTIAGVDYVLDKVFRKFLLS